MNNSQKKSNSKAVRRSRLWSDRRAEHKGVGSSEETTVPKGVCTGEQRIRSRTVKTMELREGMERVLLAQ